MGDERGQDDDAEPLGDHGAEQQPKRGDQHDQHHELADLDPDIERQQRADEMVAGELQGFPQRK
jgi:hypothetical protein